MERECVCACILAPLCTFSFHKYNIVYRYCSCFEIAIMWLRYACVREFFLSQTAFYLCSNIMFICIFTHRKFFTNWAYKRVFIKSVKFRVFLNKLYMVYPSFRYIPRKSPLQSGDINEGWLLIFCAILISAQSHMNISPFTSFSFLDCRRWKMRMMLIYTHR